jgi:4-alpha-glucanotransferase
MSLVRLFWIPEGCPGSEGAYVAYRSDELLGVLALESRRQGAVVIAEDLGTLPPGLTELLADWGLLRSAVPRARADGSSDPPSATGARARDARHPRSAAAAGLRVGRDLALRRAAGALGRTRAQAARAEREAERAALARRLGRTGLGEAETDAERCARGPRIPGANALGPRRTDDLPARRSR